MNNLGSDFDNTGSVMSPEALADMRKKQGKCVKCGQQCFKKKGIILEPLCGKIFGPEDHQLLTENNGSIVGLDCSWKQIESSVDLVMRRTRLKPRMLPLFLAANPVNWGKPGKLSTIEALAAAAYLCGHKEQSKELLSGFRWGQRFIELNHEPLEEYSSAKTSQELVELQFEFFDLEHLRSGDE